MGRCESCGNSYEKTFKVTDYKSVEHTFDSLECAINILAPQCEHCGTRILGHGVEAKECMYCCEHCSRQAGETKVAG